MKKEVHVALATDNGYLRQTIVVIESIMMNGSVNNLYHFYILSEKETEEAFEAYREQLCTKYSNCIIDFIIMSKKFENVYICLKHITKSTYYRLYLPRLLNVDKCIYLDCDVIVCDDLYELYNTDMEDYEVAGVIAPFFQKFPENGREYKEKTGLKSLHKYINAGVLVMSLDNMRKHNFCEKVDLIIDKQFPTQDQDIINLLSYDYIKLLPFRYNFQVKYIDCNKEVMYEGILSEDELLKAYRKPYIIHYNNKEKPWECFDVNSSDKWWEMCRKTIVYNEFLEKYKISFYYYGIIKNNRLWRLEKFSQEWLEEIRKYDDIYLYGAGVKGKRAIEYFENNSIKIKSILVSSIENNPEEINGIKVEPFSGQLTGNELVIIAVANQYQLDVKRLLLNNGIFNIMSLEEI